MLVSYCLPDETQRCRVSKAFDVVARMRYFWCQVELDRYQLWLDSLKCVALTFSNSSGEIVTAPEEVTLLKLLSAGSNRS